jgi:hypothetical protein
VNCLKKNSIKIYIKIDITTAPTCFGAVTPSSGGASIRARINAPPDDGATAPKHVGAVVMSILILFFKTTHWCVSW